MDNLVSSAMFRNLVTDSVVVRRIALSRFKNVTKLIALAEEVRDFTQKRYTGIVVYWDIVCK